jgi:tetratricopeptide (TPR) repeat protein
MTDELDHARDDEVAEGRPSTQPRGHQDVDSVNRALTIAALVTVVLIVAVLGYAVYATVRPVQQPRTVTERQVLMLEALVASTPTNVDMWVDYLSALIRAGRGTTAIAAADRGIALVQDKAPLMARRAEAEYALGRKDAALETASEALRVAAVYRKKTAEKYWQEQKVVVRLPDSEAIVDAELLRAKVYSDRGQADKAIASLTAALAENPRMSDVLAMRGEAYVAKRDNAKALSDFKEALKYDPANAEALAGVARIEGDSK